MPYVMTRHLTTVALGVAVSFTLPPLAAAQVDPTVTARVDEIFAQWDTPMSPGCAVGVTQNGETLLERAYGMADLEWGIPNTAETIFEGGSVSKQFTAATVNLLVLDGVLSLDDDVRNWVCLLYTSPSPRD